MTSVIYLVSSHDDDAYGLDALDVVVLFWYAVRVQDEVAGDAEDGGGHEGSDAGCGEEGMDGS